MALDDFKNFDAALDYERRNSKGKVKPGPALPEDIRIADTHCHIRMTANPALSIARAAHHGFGFLMNMTDPAEDEDTDLEALRGKIAPDANPGTADYELLDGWEQEARGILAGWGEPEVPLPRIRFGVGVHPHNARNWDAAKDVLFERLHDPRTACLGEIGLDYHYDLSPRPVQREVFARQLGIAQEAGLPVSLHIREAHDEAVDILKACGVSEAGCIVHCFNLDVATLEPFLELGCHIAFGGPITFRKSWETRVAATHVPIDRLLTETDAPYMAPEPLRGTECLPDHTAYSLSMLLTCFGYHGEGEALAGFAPRPVDLGISRKEAKALTQIEWGRAHALEHPDFAALQAGLDERAFCECLYQNALALLDREPTSWQEGERA